MVRKCANPACYAQFRFLHQGKLFEVEIQYRECPCGKGTSSNSKRYVERYWLCDQCAAHITLQFDPRRGVVLMSLSRRRSHNFDSIPRKGWDGNSAGPDPAIRLDFNAFDQARTAGELEVRRREIA